MRKTYRADKRCEKCRYWRPLGAVEGLKVCHYCIDNNELRKRDGEKCLSFAPKDPEQEGAHKPRAMQVRM